MVDATAADKQSDSLGYKKHQTSLMSTRQLHIDMAAGIMLSWMILGHIASHASYNGAFFCIGPYLSFFMPWFFYKAGMFYQDRKETIKERVHRGGQKLLRPFVIYSLIGQAIYYLCLAVENNVTFRSFVYQPIRSLFLSECVAGNGALWFLVVLFTINVFAPYIIGKMPPILIAIWGACLACICYLSGISWFPRIIPHFCAGMAFFSLGYMLRDKERQRIVFITAVIVYILFCLIGFPSMGFHQNSAESPSEYVLFFFASVAGIIILNNLCRWISPHLSFSIFRWIGRNAMNLYVTHWIILMLLRLIVLDICQLQNTTLVFWIYLGTMVIALPLFNKTINSIKSCRKQSSIL